MNGAESLIQTLVNGGVDACFMNPGTSEIHFVAALDSTPGMRGVPCLFEGVASGAADGYARMRGKPASTLLHLGPGLSNALANLHNACRAQVPLINIVGDHASFHRHFETPLASDIESLARPYSAWLRRAGSAATVGRDCAEAIAAVRQPRGGVATLILPADAAWSEGGHVGPVPAVPVLPMPGRKKIQDAAALLKLGQKAAIVLGPQTTTEEALIAAGRIAAKTGARLLAPFAFTRLQRGAGRPMVERIAYVTDQAIQQLSAYAAVILAGAPPPVSFFGHPDRPSVLTSESTEVFALAEPEQDCAGALMALAELVGAAQTPPQVQAREGCSNPTGDITAGALAAAVAASLPDNTIVVDESITSGRGMMAATAGAAPHDWLVNTGGSIGIGMPLSVGAAVACPDRPVLCLEADGSGMYTLQALWTAARENLNITVVVFANRAYAILKGELANAGLNAGPKALDMLDIGRPDIDWVMLAQAMGVPGTRAANLESFAAALRSGLTSGGPNLIELPL